MAGGLRPTETGVLCVETGPMHAEDCMSMHATGVHWTPPWSTEPVATPSALRLGTMAMALPEGNSGTKVLLRLPESATMRAAMLATRPADVAVLGAYLRKAKLDDVADDLARNLSQEGPI